MPCKRLASSRGRALTSAANADGTSADAPAYPFLEPGFAALATRLSFDGSPTSA